jgi:hypothetical protein
MLKYNTRIVFIFLLFSSVLKAQVGVNTTTPASSLDVVGEPTDPTLSDGIIAPRLTGDQLRSKTSYGAGQEGALVYVTAADSAPAGQTINVTTSGYYYFNGTVWEQVTSSAAIIDNLYTVNGTLTGNRDVTHSGFDLNFDANTLVVRGNGRVGIGTATPGRNLHVEGTQRIASNTAILQFLENDNAKNWFFVADGNRFTIRENATNNTVFTINNGGNVGLGGLNGPTAQLDINGGARIRTLVAGDASDVVLTANGQGHIRQRTAAEIVAAGGGNDGDAWGVTGEDIASDISRTGSVRIDNNTKTALTIRTTDNTQSNGIAFRNSGASYTWNIFREDVGGSTADLVFAGDGPENNIDDLTEFMRITDGGNVGISTPTPTEKLHVSGGSLLVTGGNISLTGGSFFDDGVAVPDYVFETYYNGVSSLKDDYKFKSLAEIESYVKVNNHLPGIKSAYEIKQKGWDLSFASRFNLEKVEELFLHTIKQEKNIDVLNKQFSELKEENENLKNELTEIKRMMELLMKQKK